MGTNFFWKLVGVPREIELPTNEVLSIYSLIDDMDPRIHIGKRSAAGWYCWDCRVTLCGAGEEGIHYSKNDRKWLKACPKCGKGKPELNGLSEGSRAVELGFSPPNVNAPEGVRTCSSFSWCQNPEEVRRVCKERPDEVLIEDEYGREFTGQEFLTMIEANCPVQYTGSQGEWFS